MKKRLLKKQKIKMKKMGERKKLIFMKKKIGVILLMIQKNFSMIVTKVIMM